MNLKDLTNTNRAEINAVAQAIALHHVIPEKTGTEILHPLEPRQGVGDEISLLHTQTFLEYSKGFETAARLYNRSRYCNTSDEKAEQLARADQEFKTAQQQQREFIRLERMMDERRTQSTGRRDNGTVFYVQDAQDSSGLRRLYFDLILVWEDNQLVVANALEIKRIAKFRDSSLANGWRDLGKWLTQMDAAPRVGRPCDTSQLIYRPKTRVLELQDSILKYYPNLPFALYCICRTLRLS